MYKRSRNKIYFFCLAISVLLFNHPIVNLPVKAAAEDGEEAIIVKFKPGISDQEKEKLHQQNGGRENRRIKSLDIDQVKIKKGERDKKINEYKSDPEVLYAEPDYVAHSFVVTNDPSLKDQWGMYKIQAAGNNTISAWDITGGKDVKIAVLDTGIDETHPDLAGKVVARNNFSSSTTNNDVDGHGTHVAGVIAANSNNGVGVAGVAYSASLMNVKVLGDDGSGSYSSIISGITWAADNGAKVVNMSLGGTNGSAALQDAVDYAWNKGVVVIAAAGNDGSSAANYPAYYSNVIAVASTDSADAKSSFSQYGSWVDVAAPGSSIYSTYVGGKYSSLSGTSMASPHVAGLAGLVLSNGAVSNRQVRSTIESTADKIVGTGTNWSFGRVNAFKAVSSGVAPNPSPAPQPSPVPPPSISPVAITAHAFLDKNKKGGRLVWDTNIVSTGVVRFDTHRSKQKRSVSDGLTGMHHEVNFTTLKRKKTYYFRIYAQGQDGSQAVSGLIKVKLPKK